MQSLGGRTVNNRPISNFIIVLSGVFLRNCPAGISVFRLTDEQWLCLFSTAYHIFSSVRLAAWVNGDIGIFDRNVYNMLVDLLILDTILQDKQECSDTKPRLRPTWFIPTIKFSLVLQLATYTACLLYKITRRRSFVCALRGVAIFCVSYLT